MKEQLEKLDDFLRIRSQDSYIDLTIHSDHSIYPILKTIFALESKIWKGYLGNRFEVFKTFYNNDGLNSPMVTMWLYLTDSVTMVSFTQSDDGVYHGTGGSVDGDTLDRILEVL